MKRVYPVVGTALLALLGGCGPDTTSPYSRAQIDSVAVITPDQVNYEPLNPARGDASPRAGVLWGDIREDVPSGVLLQFAEGFSSPPHIHNITYRAVVISGAVHNDDPGAENMWMGPGTFWTQPAGEVHITSARPGLGATAFLEILEGPYLVQPGEQAFDNGERPLNLVESNLVWMNANDFEWISADGDNESGPQGVFLWGSSATDELSGSLIRLPRGHTSSLSTQSGDLKAVMIAGEVIHSVAGATAPVAVGPGGHFASREDISHSLECHSSEPCLIYLRTEGQYRIR